MALINKVPKGLLSLLGLKQLGRNPRELAATTIPVVNTFAMYASENLKMRDELTAAMANGVVSQMFVPTGQVWIPVHMSCVYGLSGANEGAIVRLQVTGVSKAPDAPTLTSDKQILAEGPSRFNGAAFATIAGAINDQYTVQYSWPQPIAYENDTVFSAEITEITAAANMNFITVLTYYAFDV